MKKRIIEITGVIFSMAITSLILLAIIFILAYSVFYAFKLVFL
jgi:hypothetical protein